MDDYPKILFISSTPLGSDTNSGNTYINLFSKYPKSKLSYLTLNDRLADTDLCESYFYIGEKEMIKSILNRNTITGKSIPFHNSIVDGKENFSAKNINLITKLPRFFLVVIQEFVWLFGKWKSEELYSYIEKVNPDIIFLPLKSKIFTNIIGAHIAQHCKKPLVTNISDDDYTLQHYSLSPFFWIYRLISRKYIKLNVLQASKSYVISDLQKNTYKKIFNREFDILFKGYDFSFEPFYIKKVTCPLKIIYAGNLMDGRWKTLAKIAQIISKINRKKNTAQLFIYSRNPLSKKMRNALNIEGSSAFLGGINNAQVLSELKESDIVLHVESFELKHKLATKFSFSTKIVDFFHSARCIFAVGWDQAASINYLIKTDAAVVACNEIEIEEKLRMLIENPELIAEYGKKAWECGKRNHQIDKIQKKLYNDLSQLVKNTN